MLLALLRILTTINTHVLRAGRQLAWVALALMVVVILTQVFFRYVLNNALAWPDEAARFFMLWMTGLVAPSAFRWGGFVSIETFPSLMPRVPALLLTLGFLVCSMTVLWFGIRLGYDHTMGFGGNFNSSSLRIPLDLIGLETVRVKLRYMFGSLLVGVVLLSLVNVELILRNIVSLLQPHAELPDDDRRFGWIEGAS